jgi:formamidopyrimidine-DNA glycosylase
VGKTRTTYFLPFLGLPVPELPEVETVKRGLNQFTLQQEILGGDVLLDRTIAYPISAIDFLTGLKDSKIIQWYRRGKYLLAALSRGQGSEGVGEQGSRKASQQNNFSPSSSIPHPSSLLPPPSAGWLGVHLRMTGQLLWLDRNTPLQKHARVRLFFPGNLELRYVDQRTFGRMWWVPPGQAPESVVTGLQKMGPEPFSEEFSVEYLVEKLRDRRRPIKTALLDQELVAGVGNIYADESLFLSRINPETLCSQLSREQIDRLRLALIQVLNSSIAVGGTTFSTFLNVHGVNGNYRGEALVYARAGEACQVCATPIQRLKLAGRSAHFCPQCQV